MGVLQGANVAIGVTGSIAAVRVVELVHELRREGASVRAVTTPSAETIVSPWAIQYATGTDVVTELTGQIEHVELCGRDGWADVLLIAPATANTIGKVAAAIDDTPVTTCATVALGADVPVVVAPAMHEPMYDHPGVLDSIATLEQWGVEVLPPRIEEGKAKLASDDLIALATARAVGDRPLSGRSIVVTAGSTSEPIDPVRVITARASGRMGRAIARACYAAGGDVTLVQDGSEVPYATVRRAETAAEMLDATEAACADADALVSAAAISDYTPLEPATAKIPSGQSELSIALGPTPKLLDQIRGSYPDLSMVGFKLETGGSDDELIEAARELQDRVGLAFVVANTDAALGADELRAHFVTATDVTTLEDSKQAVGQRVAAELATVFEA